jgi:hypothetical protein
MKANKILKIETKYQLLKKTKVRKMMEALKLLIQMQYNRFQLMSNQVCLFSVLDRKNLFIIVIYNLTIIIA